MFSRETIYNQNVSHLASVFYIKNVPLVYKKCKIDIILIKWKDETIWHL